MKTLRKALLGLLFLAPLLLPSQTKAGPFDDWIHSLFSDRRQPQYQPAPAVFHPYQTFRGRSMGPATGFRPFDPFADRNHPGADPLADPAGNGNAVPIDGGLVFLLMAGLGLGMWKVYERKRRSEAAVM